MAIDDRLYDLQESDDHRFPVYSSVNAYIAPYSSDTHGGELLTEYNQRAAINTLLRREVNAAEYADAVAKAVNETYGAEVEQDSTTGVIVKEGPGLYSFKNALVQNKDNWQYTAYATGAPSEDDFKLSLTYNKLTISAGSALVYGYFIDVDSEITIPAIEVISPDEVAEVKDNPGQNTDTVRTKFVKLAIQYTASESARHDERLIPPAGSMYPCVVIVINDELPYGNELLLGTVSRDAYGSLMVTQNPSKSRLVPLTGVEGAENYSDLINTPDDDSIYGIQKDGTGGSSESSVTNLIKIDQWLWIHFGSYLGQLLRNMSTEPDTAGNAQLDEKPTRGVIVSDATPIVGDNPVVDRFNCLQKVNARTTADFARVTWHQAQVPAKTPSGIIDARALYLPYAALNPSGSPLSSLNKVWESPGPDSTVTKPVYDINTYPSLGGLNGMDGLMTTQQLAMLELVFDDYANRKSNGFARGRQFGPFLTLEDAKEWFERYTPVVGLGDYFWVINDTAEAGGTEVTTNSGGYTLQNIIADYGTVSGTVSGTAKQAKLTVPVTGTVTGHMDDAEETAVEGEVAGTGTGTINATVSGTVTGSLNSFIQNVSSRYVCRYYDSSADATGVWRFAHAVMPGEETINTYFTSSRIGSVIPGTVRIFATSAHPVHNSLSGLDYTTTIYDDGEGSLMTTVLDTPQYLGDIDYDTGLITNLVPNSLVPVKFLRSNPDSYLVLDPEGQSKSFQDTSDSKQSVLFVVEAVERGFAVPATADAYGVVRTGTGSELEDIINDPNTQRLRVTDALLDFVKNGGYKLPGANPPAEISISPNEDLTYYQYTRYPAGVVFKMTGRASEWRAASGTLAHLRGDITLDFTDVTVDGTYSDGLLLHLEDIDYLTLKGDSTKPTSSLLFGVNHCKVNSPFFINIGEWKYSEFLTGGNTLELDLPWMIYNDLFTTVKANSLSCRFASVTMGEKGISSAMLDVWVKHEGWSDYNGNIDRMWASLKYLNFPPLFFEYTTSETQVAADQTSEVEPETTENSNTIVVNQKTRLDIPDNLNLKVTGTSGVHQSYDANNTTFVPNGNLLVNLNWEYNGNPSSAKTRGGKVYLNLYMKNSSPDVYKQNFTNLRFRAPVQVIRLDDNSMSNTIPYTQLYPDPEETLN
jgi:hypothetical protein